MRERYRVVWYLGLALLVVGAACKSGTEPPTPTSVSISPPGALTFASVGASQQLTAQVLDQHGAAMPTVTVVWSSNNTAAATVSGSGVVTATGNGTATITATATGTSASGSVSATVAQVATALTKVSGDAQGGLVGAALGAPITVRANDALGSPVPGVAIAFAVTSGGGNVANASVTTNSAGQASTNWTVGTNITQAQTATASASGLATVTFTATANAGPAAAIAIQAGNNQTVTVGVPVPVKPSVKVTDSFGNARASALVQFTVTAGGGSVTGGTQTADAQGIATVGNWTMGTSAGANSMSAVVVGTSLTATFNATAQAAGAAANMMAFVGDNQTALRGFATNIRPAVTVTDAGNGPVAGVSVTFAVMTGGGSVTNATVTTNALGIAQVGSWVVGAVAGSNTMQATATGLPSVMFTATGASPLFNIDVRNIGPAFSPAVQAAFDSAKARWERVIYGDISDIPLTNQTNVCGLGVTLNETVDDILILARFDSIDGPGAVLGSAGDCGLLRSSNGLAVVGQMRFDTADVAGLISSGSLADVILHEMGHVLGFSSARFDLTLSGFSRDCIDLLTTGSPPGVVPADTHFKCAMGRAMFDSIGGTTYTGGIKVPLENCASGVPSSCGGGTYNSHWREATFFNELMTGYLNSGVANPMSRLTIAAMEDMGYMVNYAAAASYSRTFTAPAVARGSVIRLENDDITSPVVLELDAAGRVVRRWLR